MTDTSARGRFVWHDLITTDTGAAVDFYTKVAGWGTEQWNGGGAPYTMWMSNGAPLGGVTSMSQSASGMPPHWISYVCVPDTDATATQASALGGKVLHPPTDIPMIGRYAVIADPQGAPIAIFTPQAQAPGHEGAPNKGEFSWHELMTTDYAGAFDFYSTLFGWEKSDAHDMGPMGIYQIYSRNGLQIGGMFNKPADMPMPPNWMVYIMVDSADRAAERVTKYGGKVCNGPMEVPGGDRIAQCMDPQGGMFAVHSKATM
jgi:predicted enzyme related to lactoylglutathione lyase